LALEWGNEKVILKVSSCFPRISIKLFVLIYLIVLYYLRIKTRNNLYTSSSENYDKNLSFKINITSNKMINPKNINLNLK